MEELELHRIKRKIADNVFQLRKSAGWTQQELSKRSGIPRSNVTYIESGLGNPTLENLAQIAKAMNVTLEELLSSRTREFRRYSKDELATQKRNMAQIRKLIPDEIKGFEVDHIFLQPDGRMAGAPHLKGTREYFYCLKGKIGVSVEGDSSILEAGDLLIFSGDSKHTYQNHNQRQPSEGLSFIILPQQFAGL